MADDLVWKALANPKRREMLDLLSRREMTTGELAEHLGDVTRFAVMQHLGVLVEAGIVLVRRRGRQRFNHLNAVPIQRLHDRWVGPLATKAASTALALERRLAEQEESKMDKSVRAVRIENEISIQAAPEKVFDAMTTEQDRWYPYNYGGERLKRIVFEERVGGTCHEDWGDGAGILYGHVTYWDPPSAFCLRGHLKGGVLLENWVTVEPSEDGCTLRNSIVCMGEISDDEELGIRKHGDLTNTLEQLKAYLAS